MRYMLLTLLLVPIARADFDARPYVSDDRIELGGHDDEINQDVAVLHVFSYAFGEELQDPYNLGDPGFNSVGTTSFFPGSSLRLLGRSIEGRSLSYWDGTGTPSFGAAPPGVTLQLAGSPTRSITYANSGITNIPTSDTSLLIGNFSATNGALHVHLTSSIFQNGAQVADSVPIGAYLLSYSLANPGTGILDSAPIYTVFGNGLTDAQLDAAVDAVNATYLPEPSVLALFSLGGFLTRRR